MPELLPSLKAYIHPLLPFSERLSPDRKSRLDELVAYISADRGEASCQLIFICTHNSRRSHMSQIWAQVAAYYYGIDDVRTFSGGTEATAFHPNAVAAMQRAGLDVEVEQQGLNPIYKVSYAVSQSPLLVHSKVYDDSANPSKNFCAVMTCSEADENCPVVFGASKRVALHYEDPKVSDGTPQTAEVYDARVRQIATELLYVMRAVQGRSVRRQLLKFFKKNAPSME